MSELHLPVFAINRLRMEIDGEGVTTLVSAYGCPLQCSYCINPMAWQENNYIKHLSTEQLYEAVKIDNLYFQATGGGITFGGGESMLHSAFVREFKERFAQDWKIVMETSLNVPREFVENTISCVDSYIFDCKDMNAEIYKKYTKKEPKQMLENLSYLLEKVGSEKIHVRVPHIPDYNSEEDVQNSIEQLKKMGCTNIEEFSYVKDISAFREQLKKIPVV